MRHGAGKLVFFVGQFDETAVDEDEASGEGKCIGLLALNYPKRERHSGIRVPRQVLPYTVDVFGDQRLVHNPCLPRDFLSQLLAQRDLLFQRVKVDSLPHVAIADLARVVLFRVAFLIAFLVIALVIVPMIGEHSRCQRSCQNDGGQKSHRLSPMAIINDMVERMAAEFGKNIVEEQTLWERYAGEFPVRQKLVYLNHAAVSPLSRRCANAMKHLADDCLHFGSLHYSEWLDVYQGLRVAAAKLIHAEPSEIALVKNTSAGIATVSMGPDWTPGDRMVGFREEFPANVYPWQRLQEKGIEVTWLSITDSLDQIDTACRGARLLAISFVQFLSGYRAPVLEIGEICRRRGCIYLIDAIQGLGAFPLDVK